MRPGPSAYARPDCTAKPCKMGTNPCAAFGIHNGHRGCCLTNAPNCLRAGDAPTAFTQARLWSRSAQVFRESE